MIYRRMLQSKIHRVHVTHANLDYEGSITLPPELLLYANILPFEAVQVWNVTQGTRFETYTIEGNINSTNICVNGAAAHLAAPGDIIIIATFIQIDEHSCQHHQPTIVFVDDHNRYMETRAEKLASLS